MHPRTWLAAVALSLASLAPPAARGDGLALRLDRFDGAAAPRSGWVAPLRLAVAPSLAAEALGAVEGRRRADPPVCLVLGIIPGFGLGHYLAGSGDWKIWLVADAAIFLLWPGGFLLTRDRGYGYLGLLVLVERVFEGVTAYQAAGGGHIFRDRRGPFLAAASPADLALPVGAPRGALR